jgi:hypothetical protein
MSWFKKDDEPRIVHVVSDVTGNEVRPVAESSNQNAAWDKMEDYARKNNSRSVNTEEYIEYPVSWLKNNAKR